MVFMALILFFKKIFCDITLLLLLLLIIISLLFERIGFC